MVKISLSFTTLEVTTDNSYSQREIPAIYRFVIQIARHFDIRKTRLSFSANKCKDGSSMIAALSNTKITHMHMHMEMCSVNRVSIAMATMSGKAFGLW